MVRVNRETLEELDAWVETDAVKSRSEAAALFIREGLKVRSSELGELKEALADVAEAKDRLRDAASKVFG
jgi:metal-responsive CopG/Arc/MetJ family transcriptional regulator